MLSPCRASASDNRAQKKAAQCDLFPLIDFQAARLCCRRSRAALPGGLLCCAPFPRRFIAPASRLAGGPFRRVSSRIESSASPRFWLANWVWLGTWTWPNSRPPSLSLRVVLGFLSCSVIQAISSCLLLVEMDRLVDRVAARATKRDQERSSSGTVAAMRHGLQVLTFGPANRQ